MRIPIKLAFASRAERDRAGRFGMVLFLVTLGVLFLATIIGYLVVRHELASRALWPSGLPGPPSLLGVSTLIMLASSVTVHVAMRHARQGRRAAGAAYTWLTLGLGLAFLAMQAWCWLDWTAAAQPFWAESDRVHALHVVGGLVFFVWTALRLAGRRPIEDVAPLTLYGAMYWHFLDAVWLAIYVLLQVGPRA
jgi:heme/copper-type cytochrome/quinol oxidase subunit 3